MKIIVSGASGVIGKALCKHLRGNHEVHALVRNPSKVDFLPPGQVHLWTGDARISQQVLQNAEAVVHLMGEPIADARWSEDRKKRIFDSRVNSTQKLVRTIESMVPASRPKAFLCASAIGFYGDCGDEILTEQSPLGTGFLSEVTQAWENAAKEVQSLGVRLVLLRNGVVLAKEGGALAKMKPVILGDGKQWMSWIHIQDEVRLIEYAIQNQKMEGPMNLVSPTPVTNEEFTRAYAIVTQAPLVLRAPKVVLNLALGEMAQVILDSQKVCPEIAQNYGFKFQFTELGQALENLYEGS